MLRQTSSFFLLVLALLACTVTAFFHIAAPVTPGHVLFATKAETSLKKTELLDQVVKKTGVTKVMADKVLSAVTDSIAESLADGKKVSLVGFGSFGTSVRSARTARNPRTGEPIQVPETTVATFAPSKVLKDKVNHRTPEK
ncbi:histone family protein dna-binding protein [Nannochloropsis oceanica]